MSLLRLRASLASFATAGIPPSLVNVGWAFGTQLIGLALSILTTAVLARSLGPGGQGVLSVSLLIPTLLVLVSGGGLYAANAFYTGSRRIEVADLTRNASAVAIIGTAGSVLLIGLLFATGILQWLLPGITPALTAAALLVLPGLMIRQSSSAILVGLQQISRASRGDLVQAATFFAAAALLVGIAGAGVLGALGAYLVALTAAFLVTARWLKPAGARFMPRLNTPILRRTIGFGYRGSAGMLLQFFTYRLDLIIVNLLIGATAAGHYAISARLSELLWILPGAVGTVIFSRSAASTSRDMNGITPRAFWLTTIVCVAAGAIMVAFGNFAISVLFSVAFAPSYIPLVILVPGAVFIGASSILANYLVGRGHPGLVSLATLVAFAITIPLDLSLIPSFGIAGAALASTLAYAGYFGGVLVVYLRVTTLSLRRFLEAAIVWKVTEAPRP